MADIQKIAEDLSTLTVLEASELTKILEEKWGVSAAAPVAVAAAPGTAPAEAGAAEEKTEFDENDNYKDFVYLTTDVDSVRLEDLRIVTAVDLATSTKTSADFTVATTIGIDKKDRIYVLDVVRDKVEAPESEILCSFPLPLSLAVTLRIPLASISNVTSI